MKTQRHFICLITIIASGIMLSACGQSQANSSVSTTLPLGTEPSTQPTRTRSATRTPKIDRETPSPVPTFSPTPTLAIASYANSWVRYHGNYRISFEYPAIYEEQPYKDRCKAVESLDGADFGEKNEVYVRQPLGTTLAEHVESSLANFHREKPLTIESREDIEINNRPAIAVKYRLEEALASREFVFITVSESELIYTFSFIGGRACDVPEIGLSERTVFEHAVETFYLEK